MCHGNPTWRFLYRQLIRTLQGTFRCIAVDYLGFGLSDRPPGYGYTPAEHAGVVGELVRELDLKELIVMGHDWGGPIGLSVATADPERIAGLVLGNTWFWPSDRRARAFSRVMSSAPMQRAILKRNLFVERILPSGIVRKLTAVRWGVAQRIVWAARRRWTTTAACSPHRRPGSAWPGSRARSSRPDRFCQSWRNPCRASWVTKGS